MRDLREQVAGLREAEAARTADAPGDEAAATRIKRMEDAAAKAAAAAERIDGGLESTADRVMPKIKGMKNTDTRTDTGLGTTRAHVTRETRRANPTLGGSRTRVAGRRFGFGTVLVGLIVFVLGMLLESRIHVLYNWL